MADSSSKVLLPQAQQLDAAVASVEATRRQIAEVVRKDDFSVLHEMGPLVDALTKQLTARITLVCPPVAFSCGGDKSIRDSLNIVMEKVSSWGRIVARPNQGLISDSATPPRSPPELAHAATRLLRSAGHSHSAPAAAPPSDALPPGWSETISADGTPYYVRAELQLSQWERP